MRRRAAWHRGRIPMKTTPVASLRRKLAPRPPSWSNLGELHPYSGICNEIMRLYFARINRIGEPELHESIARITLFSARKLEQAIAGGAITDAPTLAATLRARLRGLL